MTLGSTSRNMTRDVGRALGPRGHDELALRPRERVRARDSPENWDRHDSDREDHDARRGAPPTGTARRSPGDKTDTSVRASTNCGNAKKMLKKALSDRVGRAALEAGEQSEEPADQRAEQHRADTDQQRCLRTPDRPAEHVVAGVVGTEDVSGREQPGLDVEVVVPVDRVLDRKYRREDGEERPVTRASRSRSTPSRRSPLWYVDQAALRRRRSRRARRSRRPSTQPIRAPRILGSSTR